MASLESNRGRGGLNTSPPLPTPREIRAQLAAIQREWSPHTKQMRWQMARLVRRRLLKTPPL